MTKELIENIRAIIVPYMAHDLRRINYEKMGEIDAEQFSEDMNEILDLAAKALEHDPCEDCISRQAAIEALRNRWLKTINFDGIGEDIAEECEICLRTVPSAQPEPAISLSWINKHIEWLKSLDNSFAELTAMQISTMVKTWKDEQDE